MNNDGSKETSTDAGTGPIRFMLWIIKCYIHFQILVTGSEREREREREMVRYLNAILNAAGKW